MKARLLWLLIAVGMATLSFLLTPAPASQPEPCFLPSYQGHTLWPRFVLNINDIQRVKGIVKHAWLRRITTTLTENMPAAQASGVRFKGCKIQRLDYPVAAVEGNQAVVVMEVVARCRTVFLKSDGAQRLFSPLLGEKHTYCLQKRAGEWRITTDYFNVLPGYAP